MQLSVFLLTGLIPLGAPPETGGSSVDFAVPAECGSSGEFFETLEREHQVAPADLTFEQVRLGGDGDGFRLDWVDEQGLRTFRDPDCRTLFRTAIVIAVSGVRERERAVPEPPAPLAPEETPGSNLTPVVLPAAGAAAAVSAPTAAPEKVAPLTPEKPLPTDPRPKAQDPAPQPSQRRRTGAPRRFRGEAALAVGGAVALFPKPAFFAELSGGLLVGRAGTSLSLRYLPPSESRTQGSPGIRLEGWAGRLGVLYEPMAWLRADLGLGVTYLMGAGTGVRAPAEDGVWLFAPELDLAGRVFARGPFAFDAGVRGWVALNAPRFEVDGEGEIYRVPPAGAALFLRGRVGSR